MRQLLEARDSGELTRLQQRLLRVDVLIVDDLGFVPFDRVGGELLLNLITHRYERRGTVVTAELDALTAATSGNRKERPEHHDEGDSGVRDSQTSSDHSSRHPPSYYAPPGARSLAPDLPPQRPPVVYPVCRVQRKERSAT